LISIQRLHDLAQPLMRVVLLIPHVLVILDLALIIEGQSNKRIDRFREAHDLWRIRLLHLKDDVIGLRLDDFGFEGFGLCEEFGDTCKSTRVLAHVLFSLPVSFPLLLLLLLPRPLFPLRMLPKKTHHTTAPQSYTSYHNTTTDHHKPPFQHKHACLPRSRSRCTACISCRRFAGARARA